MDAVEPWHVFVELVDPAGRQFYARYVTLDGLIEEEAANHALARFSEVTDGWSVRGCYVYPRAQPAHFFARRRPHLVAADRP